MADSTPVEQLCATCGHMEHDDERCVATVSYDAGVAGLCDCRGLTPTAVPAAPLTDDVLRRAAEARGEVPAAPVEATRTAEDEARDRIFDHFKEWWYEANEGRSCPDPLSSVLAYRDAVEARVRASLPSNSDRLRAALRDQHEALLALSKHAVGKVYPAAMVSATKAIERGRAALAESSASTTRPPLKKGNAQKVDR